MLLPKSAVVRVQIEGLMLQGCGFGNNLLTALTADSPSLSVLPPCTFAYIDQEDKEPYPDEDSALAVPVYFAPSREEFICEVRVPCKGSRDDWILSGTAIFLTDLK